MAPLLEPPTVEYCQAQFNLRGRRPSFNPPRPQELFAQLRSSITNSDSALDDTNSVVDIPTVERHPRSYSSSLPSPLTGAHVSSHSTTVSLPRYHETVLPSLGIVATKTPSTHSVDQPGSCAASIVELNAPLQSSRPSRIECFKRRLFSACFLYFLFGWGDGVTGTVLPYFQEEFHLSYMISSLLFAGNTCGFFLGTLTVERGLALFGLYRAPMPSRWFIPAVFNFGKRAHSRKFSASQARFVNFVIFSIVHALFFVVMACSTGFPTLFVAYIIAALSRGFTTASMNHHLTQTTPAGLGYAFGCWSLGGAISPIVCQTLVAIGVPWRRFYIGSLCLSGINLFLIAIAFRPTSKELAQESEEDNRSISLDSNDEGKEGADAEDQHYSDSNPPHKKSLTLKRTLKLPYQWAFTLYLFLYCGCETATQGLMATYLLAIRNANHHTAGYVTSGFWGGITIGRFVWGYYAQAGRFSPVQRKHIVQACLVIALVMHLLIWFVNSNIENTVSTAIIGLVFGPCWPAGLEGANDVLPKEVQMVSMGLLSAFASLGAAFFPFMTGAIASIKSAQVLTYVTVSLTSVLVVLWTLLPIKRH